MRLDGAVVLVTGASRGLGRETALLLAERGATVVGVARDEAALAQVVAVGGGSAIGLDLREPGSAEQAVAAALSRHGRLDGVVCNAGVGHAGDVAAMSVARVQQLVELNVLAPMLLARAALPPLRARQGGLLFVTSIAGALGVPGEAVYSATKAALETFADVLREELRVDRVAVSTVLPGVVDTDFFQERGRAYDRSVPRPLPPAVAARAVVDALESGRPRTVVPSWLRVPAALRTVAPRLYRTLERRLG